MYTYIYIHTQTHTLTPWSTVLLEKLTGSQVVKKFPSFYGTPSFITAFTHLYSYIYIYIYTYIYIYIHIYI